MQFEAREENDARRTSGTASVILPMRNDEMRRFQS